MGGPPQDFRAPAAFEPARVVLEHPDMSRDELVAGCSLEWLEYAMTLQCQRRSVVRERSFVVVAARRHAGATTK